MIENYFSCLYFLTLQYYKLSEIVNSSLKDIIPSILVKKLIWDFVNFLKLK
jgi:hypothetical protein